MQNGLGCGCQNEPQVLKGLSALSDSDAKPDLIAAAVAFTAPFAYEKLAPKKWKRPGLLGTIGIVVGLYFGTRYVYTQVTT